MNTRMFRPIAGLLILALCFSMVSTSALAQPPRRPGPPSGRPYGPPPPPPRRGPSDFDKALAIVGTVGAAAAIASSSRYGYYRYPYYYYPPRPVVVVPPRPPIVVERPVVIEKPVVVERPVVIERQVTVPATNEGSYSPKLGASFRIEQMQIPGYQFTAARLMSDPIAGSPLYGIGLRKGDVVTRLDNNPADSLEELERHERNTPIRYIKTGTTKVLLANIYIPTDAEVLSSGREILNAP